MLFDIDGNKINWIPHPVEYETWKNQLTTAEIEAIFDELSSRVSEANVRTSSWIPGHNWTAVRFINRSTMHVKIGRLPPSSSA